MMLTILIIKINNTTTVSTTQNFIPISSTSPDSSSVNQLWSPGINTVIAIVACVMSVLLATSNLILAYRSVSIMKRMVKFQETSFRLQELSFKLQELRAK